LSNLISTLVTRSVRVVPYRVRHWIKHLPGVAWLQRQFVSATLDGAEIVHTIDAGPARGVTFRCLFPAHKTVWLGTYEPDLSVAIAAAIRPGDVCFDIGGWHGYFSGLMAARGAKLVRVYEPMPENLVRLRDLVALNPKLQIDVVAAAVGDHSGEIEFSVMPDSSMGKLSTSKFQSGRANASTLNVKLLSLDDEIQSGQPLPQLIKIDVEGAEIDVLKGAENMLKSAHPQLFIEMHSREIAKACCDYLASLGYQVKILETGKSFNAAEVPDVCHAHAVKA
jgi:FkbM family methyltransferase